jgi:hypothetical protein
MGRCHSTLAQYLARCDLSNTASEEVDLGRCCIDQGCPNTIPTLGNFLRQALHEALFWPNIELHVRKDLPGVPWSQII